MMHMTTADQLNATLGIEQFVEQFLPGQSNRIHPQTANIDRRMMHEQRNAIGICPPNLLPDPFNLVGFNSSGHRTWDVRVNPKAQPSSGAE